MLFRGAFTLPVQQWPEDGAKLRQAVTKTLSDFDLGNALGRLYTADGIARGRAINAIDTGEELEEFARSVRFLASKNKGLMLQGMLTADESDSLFKRHRVVPRGNIPIGPADLWTPYAPGGGIFGDRRQALELIGADQVADPNAGEGVNVAILDYGISGDWLATYRAGRWGKAEGISGGWRRYGRERGRGKEYFTPGHPRPGTNQHGHMLARNILSIAPAAKIWDVPLLPDTALGPPGIAMAEAIFFHILTDIGAGWQGWWEGDAAKEIPKGPWILVNAWNALNPAIYDNVYPGHPYSDNPDHCFVEDMPKFGAQHIDVVFAAGNCGTPGALPLCAESSIGPGHSIHGVNAHPSVLTVGATRVDGVPIGASAQGPGMLSEKWHWPTEGRPTISSDADDPRAKPDICTPSHFRETEDGHVFNTGTSAACGVAAGMLALLRGREVKAGLWGEQPEATPRTPEQMRALLRASTGRASWDRQLGWGIANLAVARKNLGLG